MTSGWGALAGVESVEFFVAGGDFGFDVLADAGEVVVDLDGDLLEAGGDAGDGAAGGDGVLPAHAAEEVKGVLGEVADVLVVAGAAVDDAVQPAQAGPGLDQGEPGLGVVKTFKVAFQPHDQFGLGDGAVGEVALHQRRVEAEIGRGEQPDRARALQVAVELEQVDRRQRRVVVHPRSSI